MNKSDSVFDPLAENGNFAIYLVVVVADSTDASMQILDLLLKTVGEQVVHIDDAVVRTSKQLVINTLYERGRLGAMINKAILDLQVPQVPLVNAVILIRSHQLLVVEAARNHRRRTVHVVQVDLRSFVQNRNGAIILPDGDLRLIETKVSDFDLTGTVLLKVLQIHLRELGFVNVATHQIHFVAPTEHVRVIKETALGNGEIFQVEFVKTVDFRTQFHFALVDFIDFKDFVVASSHERIARGVEVDALDNWVKFVLGQNKTHLFNGCFFIFLNAQICQQYLLQIFSFVKNLSFLSPGQIRARVLRFLEIGKRFLVFGKRNKGVFICN